MCVTRTNESFNDIIKKNKLKALENKYIHIKYMYKVIQFVKLNAKFISYFFFYTCFYSHQQRKGTNRNKELFDRANDVNLIKVFVVKKIDVFDARAIDFTCIM